MATVLRGAGFVLPLRLYNLASWSHPDRLDFKLAHTTKLISRPVPVSVPRLRAFTNVATLLCSDSNDDILQEELVVGLTSFSQNSNHVDELSNFSPLREGNSHVEQKALGIQVPNNYDISLDKLARPTRRYPLSKHMDTRTPDMRQERWFPYIDQFKLNDGTSLTSKEVINLLSPSLVEGRKQKLEWAAKNRSFAICPVVEGLDDLGNISAVFRSAEAFGCHSVHVIAHSQSRRYKQSRNISMGSEKWLDVEIWDNSKDCIQALQQRGYRIAVTHVSSDAVAINEIDWTVPTGIIFGNEKNGISEDALLLADIKCSIPMVGMIDSLNVSVAAGILMHQAVNDRIARAGSHGDLDTEQQRILTAELYLRHKCHAKDIVQHLISTRKEAGS